MTVSGVEAPFHPGLVGKTLAKFPAWVAIISLCLQFTILYLVAWQRRGMFCWRNNMSGIFTLQPTRAPPWEENDISYRRKAKTRSMKRQRDERSPYFWVFHEFPWCCRKADDLLNTLFQEDYRSVISDADSGLENLSVLIRRSSGCEAEILFPHTAQYAWIYQKHLVDAISVRKEHCRKNSEPLTLTSLICGLRSLWMSPSV